MRIEIEKQIDEYTRHLYQFNTFDFNAVFIGYLVEVKPKGKRKWTVVDKWDKYENRNSTIPEPPIPEDIRYQAYYEMKKHVRVLTWDEWKKSN